MTAPGLYSLFWVEMLFNFIHNTESRRDLQSEGKQERINWCLIQLLFTYYWLTATTQAEVHWPTAQVCQMFKI